MQGPSFFTKYCLNRYAITLDIYICMGISPDLIHDYKYTHETWVTILRMYSHTTGYVK